MKPNRNKLSRLAILSLGMSLSAVAAAGNVDVDPSSGVGSIVTIRGSADSDNIAIRQTSRGDIRVVGRNGTTVSLEGGAQGTSVLLRQSSARADRLTIFMREGNDRVVFVNVERPRMDINLDDGNDFIRLRNSNFTQGSIEGNDGRDIVVEEISALTLDEDIEVLRRVTSTLRPETAGPVTGATTTGFTLDTTVASAPIDSSQRYVMPANLIGSTNTTFQDFNANSDNGRPEDVLDFSAVDADSTQAGNQAFTLVHSFTRTPGELLVPRFAITAGTNISQTILGDVDGDGVSDFRIRFFNVFGNFADGPWGNNIVQ